MEDIEVLALEEGKENGGSVIAVVYKLLGVPLPGFPHVAIPRQVVNILTCQKYVRIAFSQNLPSAYTN